MKTFILFSFGLLFSIVVRAQDNGDTSITEPGTRANNIGTKESRLTAVIEWRSGYQFKGGKFQKAEFYAKPEWEVQLSKNVHFKTIGRIYFDAIDELEPGKPRQVEVSQTTQRGLIGDLLEVELREFYIDLKIKNHYLTVGKQQIVWGKADGLKILDVVNPSNLREFLLDDFDNSRIPLWSVKSDIDFKIVKLQLVLLPDQTYHDIPDRGAAFYPEVFSPSSNPGTTLVINPLKKPNRILQDSDAGIRISSFIKGWDVTVNYMFLYDDFPLAATSFSPAPVPTITVTPQYKRLHMAGGTFVNSFGKFSVRGELGFFINKYFPTEDISKPQGIFKSTQFMAVAGVDYSGISNSLISMQIFEDYVFKNISLVNRNQSETFISLLMNRSFKNETLAAEIIGVQSIRSGSGFIRPSVKYQFKSNIFFKSGADLFYGPGNDFLGQFVKKSRATFGIQVGL